MAPMLRTSFATPWGFLQWPRQLRDKIYDCVLDNSKQYWSEPTYGQDLRHYKPTSLLLVCRQVQRELEHQSKLTPPELVRYASDFYPEHFLRPDWFNFNTEKLSNIAKVELNDYIYYDEGDDMSSLWPNYEARLTHSRHKFPATAAVEIKLWVYGPSDFSLAVLKRMPDSDTMAGSFHRLSMKAFRCPASLESPWLTPDEVRIGYGYLVATWSKEDGWKDVEQPKKPLASKVGRILGEVEGAANGESSGEAVD